MEAEGEERQTGTRASKRHSRAQYVSRVSTGQKEEHPGQSTQGPTSL